MKTSILLVDDHQIMREGLRSLLERESDFEIIGEAEDGRSAVKMARELGPDVVVMDIGMKDLNGIDATRQIRDEVESARIVALSMHSARQMVAGMLKAGASGYVLKKAAVEELVEAVRSVRAGRIFTSSSITDLVVADYVRQISGGADPKDSPLTTREREVLQLLAEGRTTKEIAAALFVSVNTVDTHRRRTMEKLDLHSIAELTRYAIREGLTTIED